MSSRDLTAGMSSAIADGTVRPAIFYEGEFASADTSTSRALLHLDGTNGAATFTDEYGNTFARVGTPALSTTYSKFGAASLLSSEANEYIKTTGIVPNAAAWTLDAWVRWSPLPTNGFLNSIFSIQNAGGYGFQLSTYRTATALTFRHWFSTNGTSWNVMDSVDAAAGTVAADTWYHIAATYDPDTATIYTYLDGVKVKEQAAAAVNACTEVQIGATAASTRSIGGYLDEFRLSDVCHYPGGTTFTPAAAAFDKDSQFLRLFTGIGTLPWNGYTWTGGGDLLAFSPITEKADVQAVGFSVTISGMPSAKIDLALTKLRQGKPGKLWLGIFNAAGALVADPYMLRRGKFDIAVISRSGETCTIEARYEDRLIDLERPRARRYTSADQQRDYPDDLGFDFVPSLQDMDILWR